MTSRQALSGIFPEVRNLISTRGRGDESVPVVLVMFFFILYPSRPILMTK